jgi:hypothetical protein
VQHVLDLSDAFAWLKNGLTFSLTAQPRVTSESQEQEGDYLFSVWSNGSSLKDKDPSCIFAAPKQLCPMIMTAQVST